MIGEAVPIELIPDELKSMKGTEVPLGMLPDEFKPTPTTRTPYPTVGEGYDPFKSSMKLADVRRKRSEEAKERVRAKGEQIKTGEPGLWTAPSPPAGKGFIPFLGTVEKRLTGEKEWGSPETIMEPGFEVAEMYLGGKVIGGVSKAIRVSTWFRMLTNKQRGLITQTIDDMLKARSSNLREAEREVASRLGRPPQMYKYTDKNGNVGFTDDLSRIPKESTPIRDTEQIYKSEQDLLLAKSKYHRQTSELIKDYKISPTEGEIARSVESYGKKLAEGRMKGEGKPSITPPGVPSPQPVPPEVRPSGLPQGIVPSEVAVRPKGVPTTLPTGLVKPASQEVPVEMVPEGLVAKPEPKVEGIKATQPLPIEKVLPEAPPAKVEVPVEKKSGLAEKKNRKRGYSVAVRPGGNYIISDREKPLRGNLKIYAKEHLEDIDKVISEYEDFAIKEEAVEKQKEEAKVEGKQLLSPEIQNKIKETYVYPDEVQVESIKWEELTDKVATNIPKELENLRIENYYGREIIRGEGKHPYKVGDTTHTFDAKTGEKLEDFELGKTRELVESKRRDEKRKAEIAELPDVQGKKVEPSTKGKIDTPKAQKTYLLDAIDDAIKEAPETIEPIRTGLSEAEVGPQIAIENTSHVIIEVPGDGTFRIVNSKESLEGFKKLAEERFPSTQAKFGPTKVKTATEKSTGRRISPKTESAYEYVSDYTPKRVVDADYQSELAGMVGEGWFSNGHYMIKGSPPVGFGKKALETKKQPLTKEIIKQVMPSIPGMSKADYMVEFHIMDSSTNSALVVSGEKMVFFDPAYMDIIKKYHPDATVYIKEANSPMIVRKGNETIAVLMPIMGEIKKIPTHVIDWMKENNKRMPGVVGEPEPEGGVSTEQASVGAYDVGGAGGGAAKRPHEQPDRMVNIVEMPEMVELFNKLSGGKYPTIKEKLRAFHGLAQGLYRTGKGKIDLRADLFADPVQAKATLAHEIFHLVDDLPEYILKQRGNIFGRIASLKKYMKKYLEAYEGAPGPLTNIDKSRLMKEAREALKLEKATAEEQATSFKDIKLLPEDIKAIWNDVEARNKIRPIYDFIVSLNEVEKNQIVREAMKGIVSEANQRRFRISMPIGDRPFKDWDQRLRDIFNKLVQEEIEKRQLFTYDTMMSELKNLSTTWKPFTPIPGDKFTKYRFSPAELYADAGSVLLNNPALLADKAPSFYKAFFNYIHRKPEVKQVYDDIQARIGMGEEAILGHRREEVGAMFNRGEEALAELRKPHPYNIVENLRTAFVSKREGLLKLKREAEKRGGKLDPEKNPDYWTEELPYISGPIFDTLRDINNVVLKPAQAKGITQSDIGEYLLYRREATERAKIANPKGYTEADALKQMDFLKKELGDEKFNNLTDLVNKNWEIRQKDVFPILEKARVFSPDTMGLIKNNEDYATFGVIEHLEEKYGPNITAKIYRQIGTLKEVVNPLTATVMKDMSLVRMAERKMIAEGTVNFLKENFPEQIKPADTKWMGKYQEIKEPSDPKLGLIAYTHEGKVAGYYVPKSIANIFNKDPYDFQPILRILSVIQRPFKEILVSKNPGWWVWNIQRDIKAMAKQIPGMDVWWHPIPFRAIKYAIKALPDAYKDVFKDVSTEDVKAMYQIKALGVGRYWASSELGPESHLDKIVQSFGETPAKYDWNVLNPYKQLWKYLQAGSALLDKFGGIGERLPKIAAYKFLKENTSLGDKEIAHLIRKRAGSPDFWEKGGLDFLYNNVFWFSNAGKEGIRAALEAAQEDPAAYTWKTIKYDVLPKLLMLAGGAGLLGGTIKKLMDNIPERDKGNYLTIPIGETSEGKTVYFVMPHDFQGQIVGGLIWKAMRTGKAGNIGDIIDYMSGGLPYTGFNPLLGLASDWKQYFTGKNPYDAFRGKYVLPEKVFEAGGKEAIEGMAKYSSNQLGGGIVYRFKGNNAKEIKNELEKLLGLPIAGNFLNRFLRVSDAGRTDELRYVSEETRSARAKELIKMDNAIRESFIEPSKITMHPKQVYDKLLKDKSIQRHTYNEFLDRLTNSYAYKIGTPESDAILGAKSTEEKARIILKIVEKQKH